jgi:hypothetical protein
MCVQKYVLQQIQAYESSMNECLVQLGVSLSVSCFLVWSGTHTRIIWYLTVNRFFLLGYHFLLDLLGGSIRGPTPTVRDSVETRRKDSTFSEALTTCSGMSTCEPESSVFFCHVFGVSYRTGSYSHLLVDSFSVVFGGGVVLVLIH